MSEEREGTAAEFGSMLAGARDAKAQRHDHLVGVEPEHPEPEQPKAEPSDTDGPDDEQRTKAARLLGLDPSLAHRLKGDTVQELVSDAAELGATIEAVRAKQRGEQAKPTTMDGGVRQPAPGQGDATADHGQFLVEIIRQQSQGGGGW